VAPRYVVMLLALGAIWGASYLFNEIALRDLEPAALIEGRFLVGLAFLVPAVSLATGRAAALAGLRAAPWRLAVVALLNAVAPFLLIAWGQQWIDSGLTGILLASSPLFTALVATTYHREERATGLRLAGVLVGFVGVALLLGVQPASGRDALLGAVAVVGAALLYSVSGLYIGRRLGDVPPLAVAVGTTLWAALLTLPLALLVWPDETPGLGPVAAVVVLGVGGTGVAYILYFALIGGAGASRAILVNYLIPTMAVAYGVALLDEPLTLSMVAGLALILAGVSLGTGVLGGRR
jgi:drug/metabolite transporter (DMT)-like permease